MIQNELWHGDAVESEEDTAGEGMDTPPLDSVTTDGYTDHLDPIDFIETHPRDWGQHHHQRLDVAHPQGYAHPFNKGVCVGRGVIREAQYEKLSMLMQMEDGSKKGDHFLTLCYDLFPIPFHLPRLYPPSPSSLCSSLPPPCLLPHLSPSHLPSLSPLSVKF